jgi:hypothetical protein
MADLAKRKKWQVECLGYRGGCAGLGSAAHVVRRRQNGWPNQENDYGEYGTKVGYKDK